MIALDGFRIGQLKFQYPNRGQNSAHLAMTPKSVKRNPRLATLAPNVGQETKNVSCCPEDEVREASIRSPYVAPPRYNGARTWGREGEDGSFLCYPEDVDEKDIRSPYVALPRDNGAQAVGQETKNVSCCLLYTSPSPRDGLLSRMPSSA